MTDSSPAPLGLNRRRLLRTGAAAFGGAGVGWTAASALAPSPAPAASAPPSSTSSSVPIGGQTVNFHGPHQAGIATSAQAHLSLIGLDFKAGTGSSDIARMMRLLTDDASRLTSGMAALADTEAELGAKPANLTATFGFGPRVMAQQASGRGGKVDPLPAFKTDALVEEWGQTDMAIQICADDPLTLAHARRMLLKDSAAFADLVWVQDGFLRARGVESDGATPRNIMGQIDGTVNPAESDANFADLIWSDAPGFAGGTFMVVRRIRAIMETWDQVDRPSREASIGRKIDTGAPLTGELEFDEPDFEAVDDFGLPVIDPASHIARSRALNDKEHFLRRAYNYAVADPKRPLGEDTGLVFIAFAASIPDQFVPVQARLAELDLLNEWTTAIGSAVYAIPPGTQPGQYVGQGIFT